MRKRVAELPDVRTSTRSRMTPFRLDHTLRLRTFSVFTPSLGTPARGRNVRQPASRFWYTAVSGTPLPFCAKAAA
jgi:hypothetical protein